MLKFVSAIVMGPLERTDVEIRGFSVENPNIEGNMVSSVVSDGCTKVVVSSECVFWIRTVSLEEDIIARRLSVGRNLVSELWVVNLVSVRTVVKDNGAESSAEPSNALVGSFASPLVSTVC